MCLVSYTPLADGFIISSNRDEAPSRSIEQLKTEKINGKALVFPMDSKGGSWIFCNENGKVAVILNGAFFKHAHRPPYKISRGLMLKEYFQYNGVYDFISQYEFEGIEPFTALFRDEKKLIEFRWDGQNKHFEILNQGKAHVFSSCTLYDQETIKERAKVFHEMLQSPFDESQIKLIHRKGSVGDPENDFIMGRADRVKTVSVTHVLLKNQQLSLEFEHLLTNASYQHQF